LFDLWERLLKNEKKVVKQCHFEIETKERYLPEYEMTEEESEKYSNNEQMFFSLIDQGLFDKNKSGLISENKVFE